MKTKKVEDGSKMVPESTIAIGIDFSANKKVTVATFSVLDRSTKTILATGRIENKNPIGANFKDKVVNLLLQMYDGAIAVIENNEKSF